MRRLVAALALFLGLASAALAQVVNNPTNTAPAGAYNSSAPTCTDGKFCRLQTDVNGQLKVAASVSASIAGFAPAGTYANLTATNASADVALPVGAVVIAYNTGTTAVSCNLTIGAGTATANKDQIQASSWIAYTVGSNTHASCIDQAGSASNVVVLSGGSGIPTGAGGGGGGGGGGGAITAASSSYAAGALSAGAGVDGWDLTKGAKADVACTTDIATCTLIALLKRTNQNLTTVNTTASSSIPAGAALIGKVGIDQTTPGTTNGVQVNAALPAGTNLVGKVGIDQTTPGTTNGVQVNAALPAGTNVIGALSANQSTNMAQVGGAAVALGQAAMVSSIPVTMANNQAGIGSLTSQYPQGAIPETASATGTTGATTATLATAVGKTTYICGFSIRANATSAVTGTATVTGVITATMSFTQWTAPLASGIGLIEQRFAPCVPASTTNTAIAVVSSAPGTGGNVSVAAWGYQL